MKIAFATGIHPPDLGGPAVYVRALAHELLARGHHAEVVTYAGGPPAPASYPVHAVPRRRALPLRYASYFRAVRRAAAGADLVYLQDALSAGVPALLAARSTGRPTLLKVVGDPAWEIATAAGWVRAGFDEFQRRRFGWRVEAIRAAQRWVARRADRVLVPSRYLGAIVQSWGVPAGRIDVVHNAAAALPPSSICRDEARRELGVADGDIVLLSAGRLVPWKGFELLIRVVGDLRPAVPIRLVLVGGGPCEARLRATCAGLGLGDAVRFTGPVDREGIERHLRASDLFVLLSSYEGFSHVLLEAMRAGLPVVASDAGGNRELVGDGAAGRLVSVGSHEEAREAIGALCRDRTRREAMGRQAALRAAEFGWDAMVERTLAAFERVRQPPSRSAAAASTRR